MAESDRKRKQKFTDRELKVLTNEVQRHTSKLQSKNLTATERSRIWESISHCVSAVGVCKRSPPECKRRWHDRRTKEKISYNHNQASATGGGPPQEQPLTNLEEIVQQTLQPEQIVGLEGIDTGKCVLQEYQGMYIKNAHFCMQHVSYV